MSGSRAKELREIAFNLCVEHKRPWRNTMVRKRGRDFAGHVYHAACGRRIYQDMKRKYYATKSMDFVLG